MKITAISDIHGWLPEIPESDILLICGDIVPLPYQRNNDKSALWFENTFTEWIDKLSVKHVVAIGGNHDFYLYEMWKAHGSGWIPPVKSEKFHYLLDSYCDIEGIRIYGTPWCTGLPNWAFDLDTHWDRDYFIKTMQVCDILISHMPPKLGGLGLVHQPGWNYMKDFSSDELAEAIHYGTKYVFCGHVHSGDHHLVESSVTGGYIANVSVLDEEYKMSYKPLEIQWKE